MKIEFGKRFQMTTYGIIAVLVSIVFLVAINPVISDLMTPLLNDPNVSNSTKFIMGLIPTVLWLGVLVSILFYVAPRRQEQY